MRSVSEREKYMNGGRRRPPRVSVGGMSSFEASGAALLAHRSLLGERRERVGARHRGQAVQAVVPVVEGLVEHHQGARHPARRLPVPVVRRALVDAAPLAAVAVVPEVDRGAMYAARI